MNEPVPLYSFISGSFRIKKNWCNYLFIYSFYIPNSNVYKLKIYIIKKSYYKASKFTLPCYTALSSLKKYKYK